MKEKKSILSSLFSRDREVLKNDSEIYVTHEKIPASIVKPEEEKDSKTVQRTQIKPDLNTAENDEYYKNLVKEATKSDDKVASNDDKKTNPVTDDNKKMFPNVWSNERFKEKRDYTSVKVTPVIKPVVNKKLTILLVEETSEMLPYAARLLNKNVEVVNKDDFLCIIRYSENIETVVKIKDKFNEVELEANVDTTNDKKSFYDALKKAYEIVMQYSIGTIEDSINRYRVCDFEVVGMGTASDNSSKITFEEAIKEFDKILNKGIKTRYFCIDDVYMKNAALFGFRTIGSMTFEF